MNLPDSALPNLFHDADRESVRAQRRFVVASRWRLLFVVVASVTGALSLRTDREFDFAAVGTLLTLVGAVLVEALVLRQGLEMTWYDGRAVAESQRR
jgi:hypothetical protein